MPRSLSALSLLLILTILFAASVWQCWQHCTLPPSGGGLLNGKRTAQWENSFNDTLPYKQSQKIWESLRFQLFNTADSKVVIGKEGWLFTEEEFRLPRTAESQIAEHIARIRKVRKQLAQQDIALVIALIPAKSRLYHKHLASPLPPLRETLYAQLIRELPSSAVINGKAALHSLTAPAFFTADTHWTPEGARAVAKATGQHLAEHFPQLLQNLTDDFRSQSHGTKKFHTDLEKFLPEGSVPLEHHTVWKTTAETPQDLFADSPIPVVLVGTSYSADERWNFAGFLREALQADVLNLAQEGKGAFAPMDDFLQDIPPDTKLVIWEIPERFLPLQLAEDS